MNDQLFDRLTTATIQGTVYLLIVWGICLTFRRMPSRIKSWLWRSVSVKFLLATFVLITVHIPRPEPKANQTVSSQLTTKAYSHLPHELATVSPATDSQASLDSETPPIPKGKASLEGLWFAVWLIGAATVLGRDVFGWLRMRRYLSRSVGEAVTELPLSTQRVFARSGYWAPVRVKSLNEIPAPAIAGLFQPTVLLPSDYARSSVEALSAALAHELAHLHRRDLPWTLLATAIRTVFWFNPLIWLAYRELRAESEIAADQLARRWTEASPKQYAQHMLEWIAPERLLRPLAQPAPGMLLSTHELTRRMKAMQLPNYTRRSSLTLGLALVVPIILGLAPVSLVATEPSGLANSAWPKFRGGLANTGFSAGANPTSTKKWTFKGIGFDSSAAIGGDGTIYIGCWDGKAYALDGATGIKKWEFKTGASVQSSPAVGADGTVYFGSWDGWVYAVDGKTGLQKWTFKTSEGVYGSPTIGPDGTVYIGSEDCAFYALNGATGVQKWSIKTGEIICSTPAIGKDGTVYFGSNDQNLYAVESATGKIKWKYNTGGEVVSSPAIGADGTVYVGSWNNAVTAINPVTGRSKWVFKTKGAMKASPSIGPDGTIFIGSFDHNLYAIDGEKGKEKWRFAARDGINSSAAISADGTVYFGSWDHNMYAVDGKTGKKKWAYKTGDTIGGSPTIASDGTLVFGSGDHAVYAFSGPQ